jgi:hypothetical protein
VCSGTALGYGSSFVNRMQDLLDYLGFGLCPSLSGPQICKSQCNVLDTGLIYVLR